MKSLIIILALIFEYGNVSANGENVSIDEKLIKEVKAEMDQPVYYADILEPEPDVLIYNQDGKLLHSFQKENIDPVAMRNADLLMEINSQKIFIKIKELNPNI